MYLILCKERMQGFALWWRSSRSGYTIDLAQAGRYSADEARSIARIRGADFVVDENEIGKSLQPRTVVSVEDGDNYEALKRFETPTQGKETKP